MRVVILGAGFAGLGVARELVRKGVHKTHEIVVIDKDMIFTYTPWLYRCATGDSCRAVIPVGQFSWATHVRLVKEAVCDYDVPSRRIIFESGGMIAYDVLVIALGAQPRTFAIPGLSEYAYTLKRPEDAVNIHERLTQLRREAPRAKTPREIVFVGAGANGVELCAQAAELLAHEPNIHITLVDGAKSPVAMFPAAVQRLARQRLQHLGVALVMNAHLEEVGEDFARCGGVTLPCDMLVFLGGVTAVPVARSFGCPLTSTGRIVVDRTFEALTISPGVFALGDCAAMQDEGTGFPDPQSAQVAWAQSRAVANNVERFLAGKPGRSFLAKRTWQTLLTVGGSYGVGQVFGVTVWGRVAAALVWIVDQKFFWRVR